MTVNHLRKPGLPQAFVLLMTSGLAVMVTAIIGPNLPAMQAHFRDVPGVDVLVPLTMSAPALTMALLGVVVGELADRWGRKRLLVAAAFIYALVGTMPLYLDSLAAIIASRFALGVFEAVLITVSSTLIGDYYHGSERDRLITLQTAVASVAAVLLAFVGAGVGAYGWRAPYALFGISLVFAVMMVFVLWEPVTRVTMTESQRVAESRDFRAGQLTFRCVLAFVSGIALLVVGAHLGYLLAAIGIQAPSQVGLAFALSSIGALVGTLLFGWVLSSAMSLPFSLGIGGIVAGGALVAIPFAVDFASLSAAGFVFGLATGILLPALVSWNIRELPLSRRGLGVGAMTSALCLGMFISPVIPVALEKALGSSRVFAIAVEGYFFLGLGVIAVLAGLARVWRGQRSTVSRVLCKRRPS